MDCISLICVVVGLCACHFAKRRLVRMAILTFSLAILCVWLQSKSAAEKLSPATPQMQTMHRIIITTGRPPADLGATEGSAQMRGADVAYILRKEKRWNVSSLTCMNYLSTYCGKDADLDHGVRVVINVKFACRCAGSMAKFIYDPIDAFQDKPGGIVDGFRDPFVEYVGVARRRGRVGFKGLAFKQRRARLARLAIVVRLAIALGLQEDPRYWAYMVANTKLKMRLQRAGAPRVFAIPHDHVNFHEVRRSEKLIKQGQLVIGFAGYDNQTDVKHGLEIFMSGRGKNVTIKQVEDIFCNLSMARPPDVVGDCFAERAKQIDIGVVWRQGGHKLMDNSAQRLSNLLSVGVPTVAYADYESYRELLDGAHFNVLARDPTDLYLKLFHLVDNATMRLEAQLEAVKIASRHSPGAIAQMYVSMLAEACGEVCQAAGSEIRRPRNIYRRFPMVDPRK